MFLVKRSAYRPYRGTCLPALCSLFFQEYITTAGQCPITQNALGAHHLIMIAAEEFLEVIEKGLDFPTDRKDAQDHLGVCFQQAGNKIAGLLYTGVHAMTHHQNRAGA